MAGRLLPIGIQTLREIRERNCYYVDKTGYALRLIGEGKHYFLARPRRFGKSLFLDMLNELFEGSRELFQGLYAYPRWDWSARYPVLRLSFGSGNFKEAGYLEKVFAPELPGLDRERICDWYNGYSWGGEEKVYNPFDALLLFADREFKAWWFETGAPTFLIETLVDRVVASPTLDGMVATDELLSTFDVGDIATEALLFQTGYLTMLRREDRGGSPFYRLGYPNREVRQSLNASLLRHLVKDRSRQAANSIRLYDLLQAADFGGLERLFQAFFASIRYQWHSRNPDRAL